MVPKALVLTVLTGGGFTFETSAVIGEITDRANLIYLKTWFGGTPGEGGIPLGKCYPVPAFASIMQPSKVQSVRAFFATFATSVKILCSNKVDIVFAVGCSHAVPLLLAGRIFGRKTIFLESITRADRLSATGTLVYRLGLATMFLVQWPKLQDRLPRSLLGTIL